MTDEDITQISLGRFKVGITGLKAAVEELKSWQGRPDAEIAQALFEKLKPRNYLPAAAQDEYRQAFLREFKKAMGEKVQEERSGLSIKILGPGCPSCDRLEQAVMKVLVELGLPAEVEHIRDLKAITALGVFCTPTLMIKEKVKAVGQLAHQRNIKTMAFGSQNPMKVRGEGYGEGKNSGNRASGGAGLDHGSDCDGDRRRPTQGKLDSVPHPEPGLRLHPGPLQGRGLGGGQGVRR